MGQGQGTVSGDGRSGLGRIRLAHEASVRLGPLWIEPSLCRIERTGSEEVFLQPRIMQVLVALVRAQGGIVTRDDLIASCWDGVIVGDDAINRVLGHLRRLSEGVGRDVLRIETITRVGYRLLVAEPAKPSGEPLPPAPAGGGNRLARICVLPFANMSEDPEQTYFSDGISEDIITDLGKVSALTVTARNTAFSFKGRTVDPREIAAQLAQAHALGCRQQRLAALLRQLRDPGARQAGVSILLVEHHMNLVMRVSDKVVALEFGIKIADGTPDEVRNEPEVIRAYLGESDDDAAH